MTVEINRKKDQITQNNDSNLEETLNSFSLFSSKNNFSKSSINTKLTEPKAKKTLLRLLGISVSFIEISNKKDLLDLTFELENTPFTELDSEFKDILKQEFSNTIIKKE